VHLRDPAPHVRGLHLAQCNGTCEQAAQIWVNGEVVGPLDAASTVRLVRELKGEA